MLRYGAAYLATLVAFAVVDALWIGVVAKNLYRDALGDVLLDRPRFGAAIAFYLIYVAGILVFAVLPALRSGAWTTAVGLGALLGFVAYATYDLTNLATLRPFTVSLALPDMAWGAFVTAIGAVAGFAAARLVAPGP